MSKNGKDRRPYLKPVQRIQLSEKNIKLRMILIVVLLSIAVVAIVAGLMSALKTEPGWQTVEVSTSNINCSQDFVFLYDFGRNGIPAADEYRNVSRVYTELTEYGYQIFSAEAEMDGNMRYLNTHPNETVSVAHELYKALELMVAYDSRYPFLAPVVSQYEPVFLSAVDAEAALYDPMKNEELASYVRETAAFAAEEAMIRVELLGNDQVRLNVAQEYLDYAAENGIETFLDFGWMKNAFLIDYMADTLAASGYTNGYIASYDGFTRNLDSRGEYYSFNLFDRWGDTISIPACLHYAKPISIAYLRNYPLSEEDRWGYHAYEDGSITSVLLDIADGLSRSSTDNLVSYSYENGCAEIVLQTAPIFITETFDQAALVALEIQGIHSVWGEEQVLRYTEKDAQLELLAESGGADYRLESAQ